MFFSVTGIKGEEAEESLKKTKDNLRNGVWASLTAANQGLFFLYSLFPLHITTLISMMKTMRTYMFTLNLGFFQTNHFLIFSRGISAVLFWKNPKFCWRKHCCQKGNTTSRIPGVAGKMLPFL